MPYKVEKKNQPQIKRIGANYFSKNTVIEPRIELIKRILKKLK